MSLTSTPFFAVLIVATVVMMVGAIALWPKVRGPRTVRWLVHAVMIGLCQLTAIGVVATWINNSYGLYASWDDLLGNANTNAVAMPGPPVHRAKFSKSTKGGVLDTYFHGRRSALSGEVLVWTPPQYNEAAYARKRFPVIMLLHGVPGSPESWLEHGGMPGAFADLLKQNKVHPFILVMPVVNPGSVDTDCSDLPNRKVATWMAADVPDLVSHKFRTLPPGPRGWGVMGFSTGGFCAAKLPLQFPKVFGAGAALDPDPLTGDESVLPDPAVRRLNSPTYLVRHTKARVRLFLTTSREDRLSPPSYIETFQASARVTPVEVRTLVLPSGGHNYNTWSAEYPAAFGWLSQWLSAPH